MLFVLFKVKIIFTISLKIPGYKSDNFVPDFCTATENPSQNDISLFATCLGL